MEKVRLNKFLRNCGVGSRRDVENLILDGQIAINFVTTRELGTQVQDSDIVTLNGKPLSAIETFVYFMLHKPKGFLCSHKRYRDDKLIYDLLPKITPLFSVGRLDKDTTGLLLVTNDGDFANKVIHPSSNITKEYLVTTQEEVTPTHLNLLKKGTWVEETFIQPHLIEKLSETSIKVVVKEGKKREVRILVQDAGLTLLHLKRVKIGNLSLGDLPEGQFIPLSKQSLLSFSEYIHSMQDLAIK